jgi:hypothetical protein
LKNSPEKSVFGSVATEKPWEKPSQYELSVESSMAYICKNVVFSDTFVLRLIKMYMEAYQHYEISDLLPFFSSTYLPHVSRQDFRNFYVEYSKKLDEFLSDENAVSKAIDGFFKPEQIVRRCKLVYKFKNTTDPIKPG